MYDCGFAKENNWFRYRAGGLLIHNNKILFVKSSVGGYFYIIGGGVHLGETSEKAVEREFFEETGIKAKADCLAAVCENFFKGKGGSIDGLDCHEIEFYYIMKTAGDALPLYRNMTDIGEALIWLPVNKVKESNIKPSFIKEYIYEIIGGEKIIHVIEERDR